ncbi:MAG: OsmC family protein [Bacteriovoracaceae bacterium]
MNYTIKLNWANKEGTFEYDHFSRNHTVTFSGGQSLTNSSAKEFVGDERQSNPEELMAGALSSCHMLTFLALCAKKKMHVLSYQDTAIATLGKNPEGKMWVEKIEINPQVTFKDLNPSPEELTVLHQRAHNNCFIANSIKSPVFMNGKDLHL